MRSTVYIINNSGPSSKPCGPPDGSVTVSDKTAPSLTNCFRSTRYDDSQSKATPDTERFSRFQYDHVVNSIECCRQVEQHQYADISTINSSQKVRKHLQDGSLRREGLPKSRLKWRKEPACFDVVGQPSRGKSLHHFRQYGQVGNRAIRLNVSWIQTWFLDYRRDGLLI